MAPEPFAGYTLVAKLGQGGMAEVYLALAPGPQGFQKLVVVKRLHTNMEEEPMLVAMFLDEARLAARLAHPNVVQTNDVGEHEGSHYIAMEYLDGQPYDRVLKRSVQGGERLPLPLAARLIADALDGLHYAHEARDYDGTPLGVVHRDISPHNLFVTYDGVVKLLDFGIAKATTQIVQTSTGLVKGKFAYMAPEQARSAPADRRADLFAMGVVLWESIAGRRLFKGDSDVGTLQQLLGAEVPALSSVRADAPHELDRIVARALQREPEDRYPTAAEMRDDLQRWLASTGVHVGRSEISAQINAAFGDTIEVQRRLVARAVERGQTLRTQGTLRTSTTPTPITQASFGREASGGSVTPLAVQSPIPPPMPPRKSRGAVWIAAGAALLIVVAVSGTWFVSKGIRRDDVRADEAQPGATRSAANQATSGDTRQEPVSPAVGNPLAAGSTTTDALRAPDNANNAAVNLPIGAAASAAQRAANRRRRGAVPVVTARLPTPAVRVEVAPEASPAASAPGFLTLDTTPWSNVTLGGRALGATPLIRVPLPEGSHTLVLTNPDEGVTTQYRVTIRSGELVTRRVGLE